MDGMLLEPWIPPAQPDLVRLALEAADAAGIQGRDAWPRWEKGGIGFGDLPPFLPWRGLKEGGHHLVLVQPRELGALVPGARPRPLPEGWLEALDLEALARPLAAHPAFPGGAAIHVAAVEAPGRARARAWGRPEPELVGAVLARLSAVAAWRVEIVHL
jgi:hypothetical protein